MRDRHTPCGRKICFWNFLYTCQLSIFRPIVAYYIMDNTHTHGYGICVYLLLLLSAFSHQGSPQRIFHLQLLLSSVSSSVTSTSAMSSFTTSINLLFGLPRFLFPGNSILSTLLPAYPSPFLSTCPYHLSLASRVFSPNRPTCAVPLMYSFLILSILVTPNENRNIFNFATSISVSCLFVSATVSNPYNIAGITATLYTFPFHSSWYSPIADHSWHSSPTIPSCLYSLLHFSSALSITLYSWAQIFEILHLWVYRTAYITR